MALPRRRLTDRWSCQDFTLRVEAGMFESVNGLGFESQVSSCLVEDERTK